MGAGIIVGCVSGLHLFGGVSLLHLEAGMVVVLVVVNSLGEGDGAEWEQEGNRCRI